MSQQQQNRKSLFLFRGFQWRYTLLVAGSLLILLAMSCLHGWVTVRQFIPADIFSANAHEFKAATMRLALVGGLYVAVMILAAAFLSHRAVGPVARLAEELKEKIHKNVSIEHLHVRSGDDLEPLIEVLNQVLRKEKGNGKNE